MEEAATLQSRLRPLSWLLSRPVTVTGGSVGAELRALRVLRGFSQKELAAAVDISAPQVSQIETGAYTPSLDTLTRFLEVLDAHLVIELDEGGLFDPSSGSQEPPAQPTP